MIKRLFKFLLSVKLASILLIVFAAVIGIATFIENDFGRVSAKALIYSKWWFELILFMLLINLIYNLKRYNLFRKEKLAVLTFHLSFIIILIGSAITRYHSFEGMMHIREGEESNIIVSDDVFLQIKVDDRKLQLDYDKKLFLSAISNLIASCSFTLCLISCSSIKPLFITAIPIPKPNCIISSV